MSLRRPRITAIESGAVGIFTYGEHAKMFAGYPNEDYFATSMHESMHASLAQTTSLGLCMSALGSLGPDASRKYRKLMDWLLGETRQIQEGLATYAQWALTSFHLSLDAYVSELRKRGPDYADAFSFAVRVNEILDDEDTPDWMPQDRRFARHCLLLDICRFAMNPRLPASWFEAQGEQLRLGVPHVDLKKFRKILGNAKPGQRWRVVLEELATKPELRRPLLLKGMPIIERWRKCYNSPRFQDGRYVGININDHVQSIIASLFPRFSHATLADEAIRVGATIPSFEPAERFLRRTHAVEFVGEPTISLDFAIPPAATKFERLLAMVRNSDNLGCYLKLVVNLTETTQIQGWSKSKIPIAPQRAMTIYFGARRSPDCSGRVEWTFEEPALCGIVDLPTIDVLLRAGSCDDIVTCLEIRGPVDAATHLLTGLASRHPRCIFAHATGRGISPMLDLFRACGGASGADVYWTQNAFESFQGGGSESLWVAFVVPRLPLRNLCWIYITTPEVVYALSEEEAEHGLIPADIAIHGGIQGLPIGFYIHSEYNSGFTGGPLWRPSDDQRYDVLGPWAGEIVLAQLTKMGF